MEHRQLAKRSQELITEAHLKTSLLQRQVAASWQRIRQSKALLARVGTMPHPMLPSAPSPANGTSAPEAASAGSARTFAAVTELIEQVERATVHDLDFAARLIDEIMCAVRRKTDASLLMGILLEGIAQTVMELLPEPERRDTAIALCGLLWDRIGQDQAESR